MHKKLCSALNLNGYNLISSDTTGEKTKCVLERKTRMSLDMYSRYIFIKCVYMSCTRYNHNIIINKKECT